MPGWMKAKNPGQPATEPVTAQTRPNWQGVEAAVAVDADGDVVYGGTWDLTTPSSPFPTGEVPAGEATIQDVYDLLVKKLGS